MIMRLSDKKRRCAHRLCTVLTCLGACLGAFLVANEVHGQTLIQTGEPGILWVGEFACANPSAEGWPDGFSFRTVRTEGPVSEPLTVLAWFIPLDPARLESFHGRLPRYFWSEKTSEDRYSFRSSTGQPRWGNASERFVIVLNGRHLPQEWELEFPDSLGVTLVHGARHTAPDSDAPLLSASASGGLAHATLHFGPSETMCGFVDEGTVQLHVTPGPSAHTGWVVALAANDLDLEHSPGCEIRDENQILIGGMDPGGGTVPREFQFLDPAVQGSPVELTVNLGRKQDRGLSFGTLLFWFPDSDVVVTERTSKARSRECPSYDKFPTCTVVVIERVMMPPMVLLLLVSLAVLGSVALRARGRRVRACGRGQLETS